MLRIPSDTLGWIIAKARELETLGGEKFDDEDNEGETLDSMDDRADDSAHDELASWIDDLTDGQQAELVALMWLGRDDGGAAEFPDLVETARASRKRQTSAYLLEKPQFIEHLESGLEALGLDVTEIENAAL